MSDRKDADIKNRLVSGPSNKPRQPIVGKPGPIAGEGEQGNLNVDNLRAKLGPTGDGPSVQSQILNRINGAPEARSSNVESRAAEGHRKIKKEAASGTAKPGTQENTSAESFSTSLKTPKTGASFGDPHSPFKSGYEQKFARPSGKVKEKKSETGKDASLAGLKADLPDSGTALDKESAIIARSNEVGAAGGLSRNSTENEKDRPELEGAAYLKDINTNIKEKIALGLRYRIPKKLANLSNEALHKLSNYISNQLEVNRKNRQDAMERLFAFRENWRNFEKAGLDIEIDGQHNEHIPLIFEKGKALHARIFKAVMGVEPPFVMLPRKAVNEKQKQEKEDLDRWVMSDYMNKGEGIASEVDKDIWNFVLDGTAFVKHYWERDVRKFIDVEVTQKLPYEVDENGQLVVDEKEVEKEAVVYDGPMMKIVPTEDMYVIGALADSIDTADMVMHRQYYTKSDMVKAANLGFFMKDAVDRCIQYQPQEGIKTRGFDTALAQQSARLNGVNTDQGGIPTYAIHECYLRYDIDEDGIDEEIVVWREWQSQTILRLTYLDRVSPTGKRPFVLKKLIPMAGTPYGLGFGEMLFGINNLLDYIANQRLDAGTFQTFPWFVFRAGSGLQGNDIRIAPGKGIAVDNVNDIAFPRTNGNTAYGFQEEALVTEYAERVSGISKLAQGQMGGQGVARTATGAASLVSEINTNLDIFIQRYQFGFKQSLKIIDKQVQELLPLGLEYRVNGMASQGAAYRRFMDRDAIKFDVDFELVGNSINSNPAIERDTATQIMQYTLNPILLQSGLVGPKQIYNSMKNLLQKLDIRDIDAYIQSPDGNTGPQFSAQDEINAIAAGVELPIAPGDQHDEKLAYYEAFENSDEFGILTSGHLPLYHKMKSAHQKYSQALAAQTQMAHNTLGLTAPGVTAQIAASSGNPQGGVPQQATDLAPQSSPLAGKGPNGV